MEVIDRLELTGAPGSPYTRKMLGILRYRQNSLYYLLGNGEYSARISFAQGSPSSNILLQGWHRRKSSSGNRLNSDYAATRKRLYGSFSHPI